jgi:hypothetical protein
MPQLLESTRNYLTSTKLGRRLSSHRDDSRSASESSFQDMNTITTISTVPSSTESLRQPHQQKQHRPMTQNRLSSFFSNRNSVSSEDRAAVTPIAEHETQGQQPTTTTHDIPKKKRKSIHSWRNSRQQQPEKHRLSRSDLYTDGEDVPRGRSPTFSASHTDYTAGSGSSSYDSRPSDYPTLKHYQAHIWRRNLLEESIMHSLQLGYGEARPRRPRSSSRHRSRSRSLKGNSGRSRRMSRDQHSTMLVAAMSKDLPPCPTADDTPVLILTTSRSMSVKDDKKSARNNANKSPYQMLLNPSTTNVTHSFASFTLELDEHQAPRVMASSAIPGLFTIKIGPSRQRGMSNSMARMMTSGHGPTPRVLTG